jgi:hypothetical protein
MGDLADELLFGDLSAWGVWWLIIWALTTHLDEFV